MLDTEKEDMYIMLVSFEAVIISLLLGALL